VGDRAAAAADAARADMGLAMENWSESPPATMGATEASLRADLADSGILSPVGEVAPDARERLRAIHTARLMMSTNAREPPTAAPMTACGATAAAAGAGAAPAVADAVMQMGSPAARPPTATTSRVPTTTTSPNRTCVVMVFSSGRDTCAVAWPATNVTE